MATKNKDIVYFDFPIVKETTQQGGLKTYTNSDALSQAIKIWLASKIGEKMRSDSGSSLMSFIGKPLDWDNANKMRNVIRSGLENDFTPNITVTDIQVVPDTINFRWVIGIKGYNSDLSIGVNTLVVLDGK